MAFKMRGMSFGNSPIKTEPTDKEKLEIKRHHTNLKKHPELYKDSFYDDRKKVVSKILKKYPNYKWDK